MGDINFNIDIAEGRIRQRRPDLFTEPNTVSGVGFIKRAFSIAERILQHLRHAQTPVPPSQITAAKGECDRIKVLLLERGFQVEFEFQGSATNGTLIRKHSDIDLLAATKLFHYVKRATRTFPGDASQELRNLRAAIVAAAKDRFRTAKVDTAPEGKAIGIEGGEFKRYIDVVPAAWYYDDSERLPPIAERGVMLLDPTSGVIGPSFPFHHSAAVQAKDARCGGHYTSLVRMLKSVVADVELEGVSSFNVTSLVYHMPDDDLVRSAGAERAQLDRFIAFATVLAASSPLRASLRAPSGKEGLFQETNGTLSLPSLNRLVGLAGHVLGAVRALP